MYVYKFLKKIVKLDYYIIYIRIRHDSLGKLKKNDKNEVHHYRNPTYIDSDQYKLKTLLEPAENSNKA